MPLAIVHDYLNQLGGAEKVLSSFLRLAPDATVYTSVMRAEVRDSCVPGDLPVETSFLQRLPFAVERTRLYLPLLPGAQHLQRVRERDTSTRWDTSPVLLPDADALRMEPGWLSAL